jgi:glycosyltransferase involved in cell wall biosynthesis
MKLLFVAGDVNRIGGIEKYNRDFLAALKKTDATVVLVERRKGGFAAKLSFLLRFLWRFLRERPDVVCCGHLHFAPVCLVLKFFFGTPYTLALYGIDAIEIKGSLKRRAVRAAHKIITISEYTKAFILKQFPDVKESTFTLPSAVDGSQFSIKEKSTTLVEKHGLAGRPIILSLARLSTSEHKGQDRVLKALPYVLEKVPNAIYLIVGSGCDERVNEALKEYPELGKSVVLAGPASSDERVDYYNLADVYVLPSKFEGFGIVFIESLACGVPVIASDAYGCREGLMGGELGFLVPPDDPRAIAEAIVAVLTKKAPRALFDRAYLRNRTLHAYGIDAWNQRVAMLVEALSSSHRVKKLAIFMSHPIQYQVSLLRKLARNTEFKTHVYFFWGFGVNATYEADFQREIKWDIPVLEGYQYSFLRNYSLRPSANFWGEINFGVVAEIFRNRYDAILIFGWGIFSNWLAIFAALLSGTRVILHGESPMNQESGKEGLKRVVRSMILRQLFQRISAFLYIGEENRKFYEHFGVSPKRLFFAPYAVDNERYFRESESLIADKGKLKRKFEIEEREPVILFVGKLSRKKRPLDLLRAYDILLKSWRHRTIARFCRRWFVAR